MTAESTIQKGIQIVSGCTPQMPAVHSTAQSTTRRSSQQSAAPSVVSAATQNTLTASVPSAAAAAPAVKRKRGRTAVQRDGVQIDLSLLVEPSSSDGGRRTSRRARTAPTPIVPSTEDHQYVHNNGYHGKAKLEADKKAKQVAGACILPRFECT